MRYGYAILSGASASDVRRLPAVVRTEHRGPLLRDGSADKEFAVIGVKLRKQVRRVRSLLARPGRNGGCAAPAPPETAACRRARSAR